MEIELHDGVVVDVAGLRQGFVELLRERERCCRGGGRRQGLWCGCPPSPLYIGPQGGCAALGDGISRGGGAKGGRGCLAPQGKGEAPPLGFPTLGAWGEAHGGAPSPLGAGSLPTSAHGALRDRWPHPVDPRDPSGGPGTIPITPKLVPMPETGLPIYKSLPPDHSGTPRDVRDLIRDSEQHSVTTYKLPL